MLHIAILEAERPLAEQLMAWLQEAGYQYSCCSNLSEYVACINQQPHDLLLVDWASASQHSHIQFDQLSRAFGQRVPLLFISEPHAEEAVIDALRHGADDYIVKPFQKDELLSRLQILHQRFKVEVGQTPAPARREAESHHGPYTIRWDDHLILRDGQALNLTEKDFNLAVFMFNHTNELLPRQRLLAEVWGLNQEVNTRTVDVHISRLRKSLKLAGSGYQIKTVPQHGYRLSYQPGRSRAN